MGAASIDPLAEDFALGAGVEGPNDVRLSDMGPNGSGWFYARFPALAFGAARAGNLGYLVVWVGREEVDGHVEGGEVFGQRLTP